MLGELKDRAAQAVEMAQDSGAEEAWVSTSRNRDVEFEYRDGALEKVKDTTSQRMSVQIFAGGRYSTHSTTDLEESRLRGFIDEAVAITRALEPDEFRQITSAELFANRSNANLELVDETVSTLGRSQRLAWCEALDEASHAHERVISATAGVYDGLAQSADASSNGFSGTQEQTYCWFGSSITLRDEGDRRAEDSYYVGGAHVADLPDASEIGQAALNRTLNRLGSEKGPTLKTTMLVDARAAASLLGRLLRPANARSIQQSQSFWAGLDDTQAFSKEFTVVDNPLLVRGLASRYYDTEGITAKAMPIVEDGRVRNVYVDTYYGRKAGMAPTTGRPSNLVVKPGAQNLEQLLATVGEGVFVTSWLGGNADSTTGDFSLGLRGHMIEGGKIARPVGEMNVTGNLRELFSQLELVGSDVYPYATTLSPSLVFGGVDFSGA
ncbi:MAG: TldD/PmbA family protein [Pseudomonadota bacterium]